MTPGPARAGLAGRRACSWGPSCGLPLPCPGHRSGVGGRGQRVQALVLPGPSSAGLCPTACAGRPLPRARGADRGARGPRGSRLTWLPLASRVAEEPGPGAAQAPAAQGEERPQGPAAPTTAADTMPGDLDAVEGPYLPADALGSPETPKGDGGDKTLPEPPSSTETPQPAPGESPAEKPPEEEGTAGPSSPELEPPPSPYLTPDFGKEDPFSILGKAGTGQGVPLSWPLCPAPAPCAGG